MEYDSGTLQETTKEKDNDKVKTGKIAANWPSNMHGYTEDTPSSISSEVFGGISSHIISRWISIY